MQYFCAKILRRNKGNAYLSKDKSAARYVVMVTEHEVRCHYDWLVHSNQMIALCDGFTVTRVTSEARHGVNPPVVATSCWDTASRPPTGMVDPYR